MELLVTVRGHRVADVLRRRGQGGRESYQSPRAQDRESDGTERDDVEAGPVVPGPLAQAVNREGGGDAAEHLFAHRRRRIYVRGDARVDARADLAEVGVMVGFIAVFGGFALVVAPFAGSVAKFLPVVTIVIGIALFALAIALILGK